MDIDGCVFSFIVSKYSETHDQFDDLSFLEFDELAKLRRESLWKELSSKFGISEEKQAKHYQSFDILAPNIIIPSAKTTYWCSVHKLPDFTNKVSGVGFESHISPKSRDIIHHIEVNLIFLQIVTPSKKF